MKIRFVKKCPKNRFLEEKFVEFTKDPKTSIYKQAAIYHKSLGEGWQLDTNSFYPQPEIKVEPIKPKKEEHIVYRNNYYNQNNPFDITTPIGLCLLASL